MIGLETLQIKKVVLDVISNNYARIKIDSFDGLSLEKALPFHVIILIKSVFNKDQN